MEKRKIAILGSTGSIGRQALEVVAEHPDLFDVELLAANRSAELLAEQALRFDANVAVVCDGGAYPALTRALTSSPVKAFAGMESVTGLLETLDLDLVLCAQVGFSGLEPAVAALRAGRVVALANKETLVAAGGIVTRIARENGGVLLPVDSEHSAIFQCLQGQRAEIEKLLLTASGGPFLDTPAGEMERMTRAEALRHPRWKMGEKITVDCSTLMNKGLEMIEAHWLFGVAPENIEIVVHPQSVIHSMVQFTDGAVLAQLGVPDMRLPIQYALTYPERVPLSVDRLDFAALGSLTFRRPDTGRFPCIRLAYESIACGGSMPCTMNAANEVAVHAFLRDEIPFGAIRRTVEETMEHTVPFRNPSLDDIREADRAARILAAETLRKYKK